ncbi:hypothetical protein [Archangium lansingense]|uniref:Bacterial surface antigen (D15) domain-containing protein n=1 Tax=Archangium lansingense TaxID=2995310 RepID=A0ABT3ZVY4_9BACT|nr:hypothetical protein [Archangium lansinium]MCY1072862.1 hypothetical protein [Archangium lansinium]
MALPALALGWLLVASAPAVKYKASARLESVVRTPLLTETPSSPVLNDLLVVPRLEGVLYTNLLEVKFAYEPQFLIRQAFARPSLEILQSVYTRADYKIRRDFYLLGVHTTTFGNFPFENYGGPGTGSLPAVPAAKTYRKDSAYIYTETAAGFWTSLGIKRLAIAGTLGWVVNGLLDGPVRPLKRGDAAYPQQRYPELRVQAFYGVTPRDSFTLSLYGRDVAFSTGNRDSLLQFAPGLQHQFSPLVDLSVEPGIAVGRTYPRRPDELPTSVVMPTLETSLKAPVPLGNHWPVQAKVRARYLPYMDPLSTQLIPRADVGLDLEWKGRREAKVLGKLRYAHPLTSGVHRGDAEMRAEIEALYPLPLSRYLFMQGKGWYTWTKHVVIGHQPVSQWYTSVGLVVRYDRGRL